MEAYFCKDILRVIYELTTASLIGDLQKITKVIMQISLINCEDTQKEQERKREVIYERYVEYSRLPLKSLFGRNTNRH